MYANEQKMNRSKLFAAIAVFAMIACAFAVILPADGVNGEAPSTTAPAEDADGTVVYVANAEEFSQALANKDVVTIVINVTPDAGSEVPKVLDLSSSTVTIPEDKTVYIGTATNTNGSWTGTTNDVDGTTIQVKFGTLVVEGTMCNLLGVNQKTSGLWVDELTMSGTGMLFSTSAIKATEGATDRDGFYTSAPYASGSFSQYYAAQLSDIVEFVAANNYSGQGVTNEKAIFSYGTTSVTSADNEAVLTDIGVYLNPDSTMTVEEGATLAPSKVVVKVDSKDDTRAATLVNNGETTLGANSQIAGTYTNNGTTTVTGTVTGTIDSSENGKVTIGSSVTDLGELKLNGGITSDERSNATTFADMADGTSFTYKGVNYTIYKFTYDGKDYQYGVHLDSIQYKTQISIEDLKASWKAFPTDSTLEMKFNDNVAISWLIDGDKKYGNYTPESTFTEGVIIISGTTTVGTETAAFNKILDLTLQPIKPTVTIEVNGWDIKEEPNYNGVKVVYTYTDVDGQKQEITSIDAIEALDENITVSIWLDDGTKKYDYSEWGTIQFDEGTKTFTAHIEVSAWNNGIYAEASNTDSDVTLRNLTDQDSILTFAPYEGETVYGVSPDRLQKGVTLPEVTAAGITAHAYTGAITATVYYYNGAWDGAGWTAEQDEGYYIVFNLNTATENVSWADTYMKVTGPTGIEKVYDSSNVFDGYFLLYLGNDDEKLTGLTLTMVYDQDGLQQDWYTSTTYTISLTLTASAWKYDGIYFYDTANSSWAGIDYLYKFDNAQGFFTPGDDIVLPSVASEDGPNGWYSQVTGEYFQAGSIFIILDKYANADGQIILEAKYDAPVTEVVTHTVTFVVDENTSYSVTVIDGQPVAQPFAPYVEGMTFTGWNNGDVAYDFAAPVTADLELTAQFETVLGPAVDNVDIGLYLDEENYAYVTIFLSAFGEGMTPADVPSGTVTITYSYMIYNERFDMWTSSGDRTIEIPVSAGTTSIVVPVDNFENLDLVVSMEASFEYTGGLAETNYMTFSPELTTEVTA